MTRKPIKMPKAAKPKKPVTPRVERTRNGKTETEAMHFQKIRAALRNMRRWWKPIAMAKKAASRTYFIGKKKRVEYLCGICQKWHNADEVEVDHITGAGSLRSYEDLPGFCQRLFAEDLSAYMVLCKPCHKTKTSLGITTEGK